MFIGQLYNGKECNMTEKVYSLTTGIDPNDNGTKSTLYYSNMKEIGSGCQMVAEDTTQKILSGEVEQDDCFFLEGAESKPGQCWHGTVMINCTGINIQAKSDETITIAN